MSLLGNIWVKLGLKSDDFNKGLDTAEKRTSKFGRAMEGIAAKVATVAAAFKLLVSSTKIIVEFQAAQSKLAAILGTTADKIGDLTKSARDLGSRTQYTASQVTSLQTELAKLGFSAGEITDMQEGVLKFAAAVGTDLASAAARAGATMRGFGLSAKETNDMLAVMAVSTSKSALSFNYLDSTLGKLIPVTKAIGLDARATISLLGTLANAGIDASSAGTALRRVAGELGKEGSKLNQVLGGQPKTMEDLIKGLQKLKAGGMGVAEAYDLVGKYAGPAFLALVNGADDCEVLYGELQDVNTALDDMYRTMTDNVIGSVDKLKSAWQDFILSITQGKGPLKWVIDRLTDLVTLINKGFSGFKSYKMGDDVERLKREWLDANMTPEEMGVEVSYREARMNAARDRGASKSELKKLAKEVIIAYDAMKDLTKEMADTGGTGGGFGGTTTTTEDDDLTKWLLGEKGKKAKEDAEKALAKAAKEYADEAKDAAAYDEEMYQQGQKLLQQYKDMHPELQTTTDEVVSLAQETAMLVEKEQEGTLTAGAMRDRLGELRGIFNDLTDAEAAFLTGLSDEQLTAEVDAIFDHIEAKAEELSDALSRSFDMITDALWDGTISGLEYLAEALGSGEWNTGEFIRNLVGPLADAAISAGTLILTTGEGLVAVKKAFESLNGPAAIAAGAALVALGLSLKAGMAYIAKNGASSGASGGAYTYTGGYGVTPAMVNNAGTMEIEGTVTVKGQDIQIALDNYNKNRTR